MLRRLRTKFVAIIMTLVGTVLIGVLGSTFVSTMHTQQDITYEALDRGIEGSLRNVPRWDNVFEQNSNPKAQRKPAEDLGKRDLFVLIVDLDAEGIVVATNDAPMMLDATTMSEVLERALVSDKDMEWDTTLHIAWKRASRTGGAWRVVICDTYAQDTTISKLLVRDSMITVIAMGLLLAISIGLSTWVLKPVEEAWEQQRLFVSDASHELKTPLAVISANTEILLSNDAVRPDSLRWVESTQEEAQQMKALVEELLELARTDETIAGTASTMSKERVNLSELVDNATLEFDAIAFEKGTSIDAEIAPDIFCIGDIEWLRRLTKILIDNACKYARGSEPIRVTLSSSSRHVTLSVNNHGTTIDAEDLPHLFDRFYRTDKARSREQGSSGGFGLGLAIARGIAESHGGEIACTSDEQSGTTFTVTLPEA